MKIGDRNRQQNTVSLGLALGFGELEQYERPGSEVSFDLAFMQAWRQWPYKQGFTHVGDDANANGRMLKPRILVTKYTKSKQVPFGPVYWDTSGRGRPQIYAFEAMDWGERSCVDYADDLVESIPGSAWVDLARSIMSQLSAEKS